MGDTTIKDTKLFSENMGVPECIAALERMPVRISDIIPLGGGGFLVRFKYLSDKKDAWVSQIAPFYTEDTSGRLTNDEYCRMISFIVALSASIEDFMAVEN